MFTPELGHFNELLILEENDLGLILDGGDNLEIFFSQKDTFQILIKLVKESESFYI